MKLQKLYSRQNGKIEKTKEKKNNKKNCIDSVEIMIFIDSEWIFLSNYFLKV
jgi:hypothetical protein